jgi:hypothetical protein
VELSGILSTRQDQCLRFEDELLLDIVPFGCVVEKNDCDLIIAGNRDRFFEEADILKKGGVRLQSALLTPALRESRGNLARGHSIFIMSIKNSCW